MWQKGGIQEEWFSFLFSTVEICAILVCCHFNLCSNPLLQSYIYVEAYLFQSEMGNNKLYMITVLVMLNK